MIRFTCPTCQKVLKAPDESVKRKVSCPRCGQRLLVPDPVKPAASNKTVVGEPMPDLSWLDDVRAAEEKSRAAPDPSALTVFCPDCNARLLIDDAQSNGNVECPKCGRQFTLRGGASADPSPPPASSAFSDLEDRSGSRRVGDLSDEFRVSEKLERKHSGLGIASFIIALLVGGLDVILALFIVINIARSGHRHADLDDYPAYRHTSEEYQRGYLMGKALSGGVAMICLNCMSIPLCLVGAGLGLVGLIAQRDCNQVFTWIGLMGNGIVILGVVGLYVLSALLVG
jgi:predicted Zn finger-like uncharacterized protein